MQSQSWMIHPLCKDDKKIRKGRHERWRLLFCDNISRDIQLGIIHFQNPRRIRFDPKHILETW
jgi:hypothetical protein